MSELIDGILEQKCTDGDEDLIKMESIPISIQSPPIQPLTELVDTDISEFRADVPGSKWICNGKHFIADQEGILIEIK